MKITLLQRDISWAAPQANRDRAEELLARMPGSDLYVFPEMFSTGFCTSPEGIAEDVPSGTLSWMIEKAAHMDCAVAGSVAVKDGGRFFNRFYFVHPDGRVDSYDKRHLFTFGGEHLTYTPGDRRVVACFRGVRILLQICYDLRFPVWSRSRGDYDMILYVASWPAPRIDAWSQLLRARAIENQCFVAGVNRCGVDPSNTYCGGTALVDPYGKTMAECDRGRESEISADIDMAVLESFRKDFPVLDDADAFSLL